MTGPTGASSGGSVITNASLTGDGSGGSPLGVADPLSEGANGPTVIITTQIAVGLTNTGQSVLSGNTLIGIGGPGPQQTEVGGTLLNLHGTGTFIGISPATANPLGAGNTNNFDPSPGNTMRIVAIDTNGAGSTITGLDTAAIAAVDPSGLTDGRILTFLNRGPAGPLSFAHQSAASLAQNRFILPNGVTLTLPPGDAASFIYDDSVLRWRYIK